MSAAHDIYDPPPSSVSWVPPRPEPIAYTRLDLAFLLALTVLWAIVTVPAWLFEPMLGVLAMFGGALVLLESWFTAIGYLHRHPVEHAWRRLVIMLAAMVPWVICLGMAALLMWALFSFTDLAR